MPTASGVLLAESLLNDHPIEALVLHVGKIIRSDLGDVAAGQPRTWTFIEFEVDAASVEQLASSLSAALNPAGGWYCDFRTAEETFVVFSQRIFRYPRGSTSARAEVVNYGRTAGVPDHQLDWPE
jgi:hypothetical protein